jgi:hypothetical protein
MNKKTQGVSLVSNSIQYSSTMIGKPQTKGRAKSDRAFFGFYMCSPFQNLQGSERSFFNPQN